MATATDVIEEVRTAPRNLSGLFPTASWRLFPHYSPTAGQIGDLLNTIDLTHLNVVPVRALEELSNRIHEALQCVTELISKSFPPEQQVQNQTFRPYKLVQNQANINSWQGQLERTHAQLFQLIGPIVAQQQMRLSRMIAGASIQPDACRSMSRETDGETIWRYMPSSKPS
jgi:hypothetical protein